MKELKIVSTTASHKNLVLINITSFHCLVILYSIIYDFLNTNDDKFTRLPVVYF